MKNSRRSVWLKAHLVGWIEYIHTMNTEVPNQSQFQLKEVWRRQVWEKDGQEKGKNKRDAIRRDTTWRMSCQLFFKSYRTVV